MRVSLLINIKSGTVT